MTTSDYIAIIALVIALVTMFTNLLTLYLMKRTNNRSKIDEITHQQKVEAFRSLQAKISLLVHAMALHSNLFMRTDPNNVSADNLEKAYSAFWHSYHETRFFLTNDIEERLKDFMTDASSFEENLVGEDEFGIIGEGVLGRAISKADRIQLMMQQQLDQRNKNTV